MHNGHDCTEHYTKERWTRRENLTITTINIHISNHTTNKQHPIQPLLLVSLRLSFGLPPVLSSAFLFPHISNVYFENHLFELMCLIS